jgi:competence protein ComEC
VHPYFFYLAILAFVGGVGIGTLVRPSLSVLALAVLILVALAILLRRTGATSVHTGLLLAGIFVVFGILRIEYAWSGVGQSALGAQVGAPVVVEGLVVRDPEVRERSQHVYVQADDTVVLVITDRYAEVAQYGDRVQVAGTLAKPEAFTTDLGRTFDYPGYLRARGVEYQIRYPTITVVAEGRQGGMVGMLYALKAQFVSALGRVVPEPAQSLAVGLLLGIKQSMGQELEDVFRDSGIIHIVVLSGYNLTIIAGFLMLVLSYGFGIRVRVTVGIIAILLFATMVGWSATVARATIMAILALLALMLGRRYVVLRALCLAGALMIVHNPFLLVYDIGFQLSFLATLGLIVVAPRLEIAVLIGQWWQPVRQFLIATIAAQIAVLPLLLYHTGEVSLVAIATNVLVLPVVPLAMLLSFLTGLAALLLPVAAPVLAYPTTAVLWYIIEQARFWAGLPYATLPVPAFSFWYVALAYGLLGFWWFRAAVASRDSADSRALQNTAKDATAIDLSDWMITTEVVSPKQSALPNVNAAPQSGAASSAKADVPVFFRSDSSR